MAEAVIMPKTGMAMEEGIIIEWLKNEGDTIEVGDILAEIETDKSTMELESDAAGTLLKILYPAGTTVPVTVPIAWIGEAGEVVSEIEPAGKPTEEPETASTAVSEAPSPAVSRSASGGKVPSTPAAKRAASEQGVDISSVKPSGKHGEVRKQDVLDSVPKATPLAARMAADQRVDLAGVTGSGHGGKIFSRDLDNEKPGEDRRVPLTNIQKITGRRMLESVSTIPMVTEDTRADVTRLLELKQEILIESELKVSVNDFIIRAVAVALREHPRMNSVFDQDALIYKHEINIGMAAATERGLLVPVIRQADRYGLSALAGKTRELAQRARDGKLSPDELSGSTFSVSNVGMYGITSFTPIINPPEAGILGVCAIEQLPRYIDGQLTERSIMTLSLSFDHRIVDGAESALFLKTVVDLLQSPLKLLV
jgi:pyruvate dehydrogenase E2 component (dihydrolipoamide acetyltransferase)